MYCLPTGILYSINNNYGIIKGILIYPLCRSNNTKVKSLKLLTEKYNRIHDFSEYLKIILLLNYRLISVFQVNTIKIYKLILVNKLQNL